MVEQLTRDASYDPVHVGGLENAALQENSLQLWFAVAQGGMGPFIYGMAPPDQL